MTHNATRAPRIVVIGAGPSGCFIAGALRRSLPDAEIVVLDRMPCPFGLVRYGVAADHQSTKNITRQFDRIFTRERIGFAGNVRVALEAEEGSVTLDELARRADAIVLATGLSADRPLGVPGDALPGVFGSGAITSVLNCHPDHETAVSMLAGLGERVAIVGMGNVAVDLIRFLAKQPEDFEGSDVNDAALAAYHRSPVSRIDVFSRSPIEQAKCDAQMIRELGRISGLGVVLHGDAGAPLERVEDSVQRSRVEALRSLGETTGGAGAARVELHLHFGAAPVKVLGAGRVTGLRVSESGGGDTDVPADSVISAIGFAADAHSLETAAASDSGRIRPGLYRVGWFRRGPRGTIPENRADAVSVAAEIVEDLASGAIPGAAEPSLPLLPDTVAREAIGYEQWLSVDRHEVASAGPGRVRSKVPSTEQMLEVARGAASNA